MEETMKVKAFVATFLGQVYQVPEDLTPQERMDYMADLRESEK